VCAELFEYAKVHVVGERALVEELGVAGAISEVVAEGLGAGAHLGLEQTTVLQDVLSGLQLLVLTLRTMITLVIEDGALVEEIKSLAFEESNFTVRSVHATNTEHNALPDLVLQMPRQLTHVVVLVDVVEEGSDDAELDVASG
jgi:hypothetical protein